MSEFTGQRFGRYLIEEKLGEGGMAVVYRASDERLGSVEIDPLLITIEK